MRSPCMCRIHLSMIIEMPQEMLAKKRKNETKYLLMSGSVWKDVRADNAKKHYWKFSTFLSHSISFFFHRQREILFPIIALLAFSIMYALLAPSKASRQETITIYMSLFSCILFRHCYVIVWFISSNRICI